MVKNFHLKSLKRGQVLDFVKKTSRATSLKPGYIIKTGRRIGEEIPYGFASLKCSEEIEDDDKILWLARTLKDKMIILEECGMEDTYFYIGYFYKDQCNCTLTKEELKALADVGIDF
ncbi:MAG: hypothetical protein SWY16_09645 [Cyanobacteriota bacterium]|nr:hypothetical protein [Cyanobacteriota bacterium]